MNLTLKTEYALVALFVIVSKGKGKPVTRKRIVENQILSEHFLEKVLLGLKRDNLVRSIKGPGGGFVLTKAPSEITMCDVYTAVDDNDFDIMRCHRSTPLPCPQWDLCKARNVWFKFNKTMKELMTTITLEDIGK